MPRVAKRVINESNNSLSNLGKICLPQFEFFPQNINIFKIFYKYLQFNWIDDPASALMTVPFTILFENFVEFT